MHNFSCLIKKLLVFNTKFIIFYALQRGAEVARRVRGRRFYIVHVKLAERQDVVDRGDEPGVRRRREVGGGGP